MWVIFRGSAAAWGGGQRTKQTASHAAPRLSHQAAVYLSAEHKDAEKQNVNPLQYSSVWVYRKVQGAVAIHTELFSGN